MSTDQKNDARGIPGPRPAVILYLDFLSPYAYLAQHRLREMAADRGWDIRYRAIDLAPVKQAIGNTGPANRDMPVKLAYLRIDLQRWARHYGVPLVFPPNFQTSRLNAGLYYPGCAGHEAAYVRLAFEKVWGHGHPPDADTTARAIADAMGWPAEAFIDFADGEAGRTWLAEATRDAIDQQIFGVPTMVAGEERFWGNDRLFMLENHLASPSATPDRDEESPGT